MGQFYQEQYPDYATLQLDSIHYWISCLTIQIEELRRHLDYTQYTLVPHSPEWLAAHEYINSHFQHLTYEVSVYQSWLICLQEASRQVLQPYLEPVPFVDEEQLRYTARLNELNHKLEMAHLEATSEGRGEENGGMTI